MMQQVSRLVVIMFHVLCFWTRWEVPAVLFIRRIFVYQLCLPSYMCTMRAVLLKRLVILLLFLLIVFTVFVVQGIVPAMSRLP